MEKVEANVVDLVIAMVTEHLGHRIMFKKDGRPQAGVLKRVGRSNDGGVQLWIDTGKPVPIKIGPHHATGCCCKPGQFAGANAVPVKSNISRVEEGV